MNSMHADEAFLAHYQLSHDPFAARVPGFKFFPAQRKPVLGQLHHLARYSQLLLVVSGPQGSGKTLLRQALVASTNKQAVLSVVLSARTSPDAASLLRQVAQGIGEQQAELPMLLARIGQLALTGQEVYLLVDDAELLDESALRALFALAEGGRDGHPHLFLFAEPSLLARLDSLSAGEERYHAIALQPYSFEECCEYLAQRLEGAGQALELFDEEQLQEIHRASGGWPGGINQVAKDELLDGMLAARRSTTASRVQWPVKHLLALLVVAGAMAAAWFMQRETSAPLQVEAERPLELAVRPVVKAAQPVAGESTEIAFDGARQPLPLPLVGEAQPVIRQPLAAAAGSEAEEVVSPGSAEPVAPVTSIAPVVAVPALPPASPASPASPAPPAPPAPAPAPAPKPVPPVQNVPAKPAPAAVSKPQSASVKGVLADSAWYRSQAAGRYVLQVAGTRSEANAQALVRQGGGEYRYFRKQHQGQPLFVVTYGAFSGRAAAQAAIRELPAKLQAGKPWPRSIGSIQQEMD